MMRLNGKNGEYACSGLKLPKLYWKKAEIWEINGNGMCNIYFCINFKMANDIFITWIILPTGKSMISPERCFKEWSEEYLVIHKTHNKSSHPKLKLKSSGTTIITAHKSLLFMILNEHFKLNWSVDRFGGFGGFGASLYLPSTMKVQEFTII